MSSASDVLDQAIVSIGRVIKNLKHGTTKQVSASEERTSLRSTSLAWFKSHRPLLQAVEGNSVLKGIDDQFRRLLEGAERSSSRSKLLGLTKDLRKDLISLRSDSLLGTVSPTTSKTLQGIPDNVSVLVPDPAMQEILRNRWKETELCLNAGAYLAAVVMTGALLEALFLARVNRLKDKAPLFKLSCTPKDRTGKPIPLAEWTLKSFIDAGHELKWIRQAARDVGNVLRDYRNFIHPEKELRQGISINEHDAKMFWPILNSLAEQIIDSVKLGG